MVNEQLIPTIGEMLLEEFMKPLNLSAYKLAKDIGVPVSRIQDILHNRRKMTIDTSIRLGKYFGVDDLFFFKVQLDLDYREAKHYLEEELKNIKPLVVDNEEYLKVKSRIQEEVDKINKIEL